MQISQVKSEGGSGREGGGACSWWGSAEFVLPIVGFCFLLMGFGFEFFDWEFRSRMGRGLEEEELLDALELVE